MAFVKWLTSSGGGQMIIRDFGKDKYGSPLFFPNSKGVAGIPATGRTAGGAINIRRYTMKRTLDYPGDHACPIRFGRGCRPVRILSG